MTSREAAATRVLVVARRSRKSEKSISIEDQIAHARGFIARHADQEVGVVIDNAVSGDKPPKERPGLGPWMTDVNKVATYDAMVASDGDRYGRSTLHSILMRAWALGNNIALYAVTEGDKNLCDEPFMSNVKAAFAEEELRKIRERCRRDKAARRNRNIPSGKVVWPFETVDGTVRVKDGPYLRVLMTMVQKAEAGMTPTDIARYLDSEAASDERLRPRMGGAEWSPTSVTKILRSTSLYGVQTSEDGHTTVLRFAPAISRARWTNLQAQLDMTTAIRRRGPKRKETALLINVIRCGKCGGNLHYREIKGRKRKDGTRPASNFYYRCDGKGKAGSKCDVMLRADAVEAWVEFAMTYPVKEPDWSMWPDEVTGSVKTFGNLPMVEVATIAGTGHQDEIEEVKHRIDELDKDDDNYLAKVTTLYDELKRLKTLPHSPAKIVRKATAQTASEYWAALPTTTDKRQHLLACGIVIDATRDRWTLNGDPTAISTALEKTKQSHLTLIS